MFNMQKPLISVAPRSAHSYRDNVLYLTSRNVQIFNTPYEIRYFDDSHNNDRALETAHL